MNVSVDYDRCQSNALCARLVPSVFEVRADGFLYILTEHPEVTLKEILLQAQSSCPTQAIRVSE
ncbi:MAG: ferredoxin [Ferrimicrobium sp.]